MSEPLSVAGIASAGAADAQLIAVAAIDEDVGFENRLGEFLDEEGDPVGARDDLVEQVRRHQLPRGEMLDHRLAFRPPQPIELDDA